jgi:hypothetical protein
VGGGASSNRVGLRKQAAEGSICKKSSGPSAATETDGRTDRQAIVSKQASKQASKVDRLMERGANVDSKNY